MIQQYAISCIPKLQEIYQRCVGRPLNLSNPKTFTEKIQWLKIYDSTMLKTFATDKITVHKFYEKMLGQDIGIPMLYSASSVNEIPWHQLPTDIVVKCNHGSGFNIILHNNDGNPTNEVFSKLGKWLSIDYSTYFVELHYSPIPHKILVEPFLKDLSDTKLFCFNGVPKFYQIDRHFTPEHRMNFYNLDGTPLKWLSRAQYPADYTRIDPIPQHMDKMIEYATKLAKPFKFVRVDFYNHDDSIYGGELTFTPGAGIQKYIGDGDLLLGQMLKL